MHWQRYVAVTFSRLSNLFSLLCCSPRPFVVFCLPWCSWAGHFSVSWGNRRWHLLCHQRQTMKKLPSCSSSQAAQREAPVKFFLIVPNMVTFLHSSSSPNGVLFTKFITCNFMTNQSFSHVKYHPHALIYQCLPAYSRNSWTVHHMLPIFWYLFGWFTQHVLSEGTAPTKCNQTFIYSHVGAWILNKG